MSAPEGSAGIVALHFCGLCVEVLEAKVLLSDIQLTAAHGLGSEVDCEALAKCIDLFETSHHQRGHGRIELENPKPQIRRARLP